MVSGFDPERCRSGTLLIAKKSIWNSGLETKQRSGNNKVALAAVRSAPGQDRAEAGFIEPPDRIATQKRPECRQQAMLPLDICPTGGVLPPGQGQSLWPPPFPRAGSETGECLIPIQAQCRSTKS
jgi:hypothetical protein